MRLAVTVPWFWIAGRRQGLMKIQYAILPLVLSHFLVPMAPGQDFANLDFESATIPQNRANGLVSETDALPGWTASMLPLGNLSTVYFNNALDGMVPLYSNISLLGTNSEDVIDGGYSVMLEFAGPALPWPVSIDQTGLVPAGSQSIWFKAQFGGGGPLTVSLGNQIIPIYAESQGPNYTLYAGDVSALAGQTVDLAFTVLPSSQPNLWILDSIEFSPTPIPEPGTLGLLAIGVLLTNFGRASVPASRSCHQTVTVSNAARI